MPLEKALHHRTLWSAVVCYSAVKGMFGPFPEFRLNELDSNPNLESMGVLMNTIVYSHRDIPRPNYGGEITTQLDEEVTARDRGNNRPVPGSLGQNICTLLTRDVHGYSVGWELHI